MSSNNSSDKTVSDAQTQTNSGSESGAIYGEASEERAARMHEERDVVRYPSAEREVELDTSIDGVPGDEIAQKRAEQGRLDRGTDDAVDGSWGGPGGESEYDDKSLYTQERIEGREAELEKISTRAGANPDVHLREHEQEMRRERQMDVHQDRMEACRAEVEAEAASGTTSRGFTDDPREHVTQEEMAAIAEQSVRLAERFSRTRRVVAKRLAEMVAEGSKIEVAVMDLVDELVEDRSVVTPISMVEAGDSWATVEGVVARLFEPASSNQQQVGVIEDESSDAKVTIWRHSSTDTRLNEGDVVRIVDGKPGIYGGQTTIAATSDTQVWVRSRGDGDSPMGGVSIDTPTGPVGTIDDEPSVELDATPSESEAVEAESEGEAESENVVTAESDDRTGVSWGSKKRQEAERKGREKRLAEKKYNIPAWRRTISRINSYEHQDLTPWGADQRMVEVELPPLRNGE
ncbi:hypothetical protein [Halococcus salsus]|uniref:hypothetical protein n=1 Tax=Halococcus salsus TaxID=2162894 RepID=UPI00135CD706|nr:hypothetical protein [Halococcus salsus]